MNIDVSALYLNLVFRNVKLPNFGSLEIDLLAMIEHSGQGGVT